MKRLLLIVAFGGILTTAAHAQTLEDRLRAQLVSVTAQLHELQAKQAVPPTPNPRDIHLKARLAATEAEIHALRNRAAHTEPSGETEDLKSKLAAEIEARAKADEELNTARVALARANEEKAKSEIETRQARTALAADAQGLEACRAKNIQALQVARYILKAYEQISVADVLARKEPVSGIARTRIEQIEQTYADQIYDSRLDVQAKAAAPQTASPPTKP